MKALNYKYYLIIALSIITIASCSKDDTPDEFIPEYLVASEQVVELSKDDILAQVGGGNMLPDEIEFLIRYGVKGLRLTYTTIDTQGNSVEVSGALLVPIGNFLKPLISFQHGTITSDDLAPSNFGSDADIMAFMLASTGFVIAMPDYIGYGVSKHLPHPYEHRATLAYATRDMIRAAREYFKLNNLEQLDGKLFMTGYSEGGTATMAAFQLMQQDHSSEFDITAVTVGAGAYNKSEFMDWVVSSTEPLEFINSYVWVLDTYNSIYPQLQRSYSSYFNEPWASIIEEQGVFAEVEANPSILFTQEFIEGVTMGTDTDFLSAIADNNCYRWLPQSPMQLYHGTSDSYVPYFNSQSAYNAMVELGANKVSLIPITDGDHTTSIMEYAAGTFAYFFQYFMQQ